MSAGWRSIGVIGGGGGDCINITKIYLHYFPQISFLKLQERRKKSLCPVKHGNDGAGRKRTLGITWISSLVHRRYLSFPISLFSLSFSHCVLMADGFRQAGDCLIYRYLLLERGTRKRRRGLKMRCVFCRPQGQGAPCVCGG